MKIMTLVALALGLSACSSLQRHPESGYGYAEGSSLSSTQQFYKDRKRAKIYNTREELGYGYSRPLSESESYKLNSRLELNRREGSLGTHREKKQYYFYKPMLKNDGERIHFLGIPTVEGRERYANSRGLLEKFNNFDDTTLDLIDNNDVAVGMNTQSVRESWGDPDTVDVAGNELYGNQAWRYTKMVSSEEGYRKEKRVIYFESGKVIGWESF